MKKTLPLLFALILFVAVSTELSAQQLRTSYFMDKSIVRGAMNPALRPVRGYVNIPVLSGVSINFNSNSLTVDKIFAKRNGKVVTFLDESVNAEQFLSSIKDRNDLNIDVATNLFGFGFYAGKGFWSFDMGVKVEGNTSLPKELFEFAKVGPGIEGHRYDMKDLQIKASVYTDLALGYSRKVNDKLTVGGKLKLILGISNIDMQIDEMSATLGNEEWIVNSKGTMEATMKGLEPELEYENGKRYFDGFELDGFGIGGVGFGVDLGATYKLLPQLTLSAAVVDLGLISWSKANTVSGVSASNYKFDGFDLTGSDEPAEDMVNDFGELTRFESVESKGRTTSLRTTINIGGEYAFFENTLSVGLLSSTQFRAIETYSELTVSGNWRPLDWLSATVSYSFIHSKFRTIGCALNLSPSWINFYIGTDYMFGKVTPQFVPIRQKCANLYFGIGIPLAKERV